MLANTPVRRFPDQSFNPLDFAHDSWSDLFLWRYGTPEECLLHHDNKFRSCRSIGRFGFFGGTVVHISAGCEATAGVPVLKWKRTHPYIPHILIGAGLLWFVRFGINY